MQGKDSEVEFKRERLLAIAIASLIPVRECVHTRALRACGTGWKSLR